MPPAGGRYPVAAEDLANPLQAKFLYRAHLVELDDEEAAKRKRQWETTKRWTWGYETQCRFDGKKAEVEETHVKQAADAAKTTTPTVVAPGSGNLARVNTLSSETEVKQHHSVGDARARAEATAGGGEPRHTPSKEGGIDRDGADPQAADWLEDMWSQCRLHSIATYPLLLPMHSPLLKAFSACGSKQEEEDADGGTGGVEATFRSPRYANHVSGSWSGNFTLEETRWGSGKWDASGWRKIGSGAIGSISEMDTFASPKGWASSSHHSPVIAHSSGSLAGATGIGGVTPDFSGPIGSGGTGFSSTERRRTHSSDFDDAEQLRSRSATSSGPGRDSFESNLDADERFERAVTLSGRALSHHEAQPPPSRRGGGASGEGPASAFDGSSNVHGREAGGSGNAGELRSGRSMSLAGLGGDGPRGADGRIVPVGRRKSSAVDDIVVGAVSAAAAVAAASATGVQIPEQGMGEPIQSSADAGARRAETCTTTLAQQFVDAYSIYLTNSLGFKPVECGNKALGTGEESAAATPRSSNADGGDWSASPNYGNTGGSGTRGRRYVDRSSAASQDGTEAVLARALLRLGLDMTNSVALVEVVVKVARDDVRAVAATAAAAASRTHGVRAPELSPAAGMHLLGHHSGSIAETMLACVKVLTLDVIEPSDCWGADGPPGGSVASNNGKCSYSWWATQPTLRSFRWNLNPGRFLRGQCLPDELPKELRRVIASLRFRNSVEDFIVGQVSPVRVRAYFCVFASAKVLTYRRCSAFSLGHA